MFVVENEAAGPPLFSLDSTAMHAFELTTDAKYRLMLDEMQLAIDGPSPKPPQGKDDSESVRRKLRDSLTSALEMVVSKQLVKSVLGVVRNVEVADVGDLHWSAQPEVQDGLLVHQTIESGDQISHEVSDCNEVLSMDLDLKDKFQDEADSKKDENHACSSLCTAGKSEESLVLKFNSETEEKFLVPQERTGGLELMEQARRVARNVELNLFSLNGGVNKKYKEKARSLLFNLKDKSNPELRARVFDGEITPKILVRMSAEQLASKELSQWRTAKAEEFASMVVLTDADLDPRRIVKKTHKGEFQLAAEEIDFSATTRITSPPPVIPLNVEEDAGESKRGYPSSERIGILGTKLKDSNDSFSKEDRILGQVKLLSSFHERVENETFAKVGTVNRVRKDLGTTDAHVGTVSVIAEEPPHADAAVEDGADAFNLTSSALNSQGNMLGKLLVSYPDSCTPKLSKIANTRCTESGGVGSSLSEISERVCEAALWEGCIQLSSTRFALINGFYKSGERLELKDWPRSVEVKGRVRLVVLDKFLQDLQLSRSRTVTILSLYPSECQGDAKQSTAYLKEMADHYRIGGRAGFVEPRPGFELYLVAPSSMPLEPSSPEDLGSNKATTKREDGVLLGVVVWRKSQAQGLPFSRGPDQNSSVKEVAFSNLVYESHTKIDVKSSHCIETPTSEKWLPASSKTASTPSLVYVSGNSSMHDSRSRGDASTEHNPPKGRDWHPPSPLEVDHRAPTLVSASDKTTENANGAVTKSVSRLQNSVEFEDVPPGFVPRPVQSSQVRSAALIADSKNVVEGCQAVLTYPASVTGQGSMVPFDSKDISKDTPGFLQQPSVNVPEGIHTFAVEEDDDLPEFNFDGEEGMVPRATSNRLSPANSSHFSSLHTQNVASESFSRLHLASDTSNRYYGHRRNVYDLHPPRLEVHAVPGGHPLGPKTQYEESTQSVTLVPTGEGWSGLERKAEAVPKLVRDFSMGVLPSSGNHERNPQLRAPTKTAVTAEGFMSMTPMDGTNQRSSQQRGPFKCTVAGEEPCIFGHETKRTLARSIAVPLGFPSSQLPFSSQAMGKVAEQYFPRIDTQQQAPSLLSNAVLPSLPPVSGNDPLHSRHQLSLVHMVVQHQHSMMKGRAFSWRPRGAPFLKQEPWRDHQQGVGTCNPSEWQQLGSVQMHYRSQNRKSVEREYVPDEDSSATVMRSGREGKSTRERDLKCGHSPSIQKDQKKRVNMALTPAGAKEVKGDAEPTMALREPKSLKRGRERERDQ